MADREHFLNVAPADPELLALLEADKGKEVSEEDLREQRISFAYGNALGSDQITKESVRAASEHIRLGGSRAG